MNAIDTLKAKQENGDKYYLQLNRVTGEHCELRKFCLVGAPAEQMLLFRMNLEKRHI